MPLTGPITVLKIRDMRSHLLANHRRVAPGCWLWTGPTNGRYGKVGNVYAHRASYGVFVGPIPAGMYVCHRCDTPLCIAPAHLFLGSQSDNMQDASRKGRIGGERAGQAKLTESQVRQIREENPLTEVAIQAACARFGVSRRTLYRVLRGETWVRGHRPEPFNVYLNLKTRHLLRLAAGKGAPPGYQPLPAGLERPARALVARRTEAFVSECSGGALARYLNALHGLAPHSSSSRRASQVRAGAA